MSNCWVIFYTGRSEIRLNILPTNSTTENKRNVYVSTGGGMPAKEIANTW